ncbi:MAG: hypothetical protein H3C71_07165, partial [Flavobacteriales bacterium]|nr:hypothetical protein [Flavobacteriales bacterium]
MSDGKNLSVEEKKELLKRLMKEKSAKQAQGAASAATQSAANRDFSVYTQFEHFPEVQTLAAQFETLRMLQVSNPYFRVNEGIVNDKTRIE